MRSAPCTLCGGASPERLAVRGRAIHRCRACDFEFVWPVPSAAEIANVYSRGYFQGEGDHGYDDYFGRERAVADEKARTRLDAMAALGARSGGAVLDIGCADGRFVLEAQARGYRARGVEVSPEARAAMPASLKDSIDGSLDEAARRGPYDLVALQDVLEHLPDPLATLRSVRAMLAPGALVCVVLPVIDNANARLAPASWDQYKPPEHLSYFSRRALRTTLERELDARAIDERVAWRRDDRLTGIRANAPRPLRALERLAWRTLARARIVPTAWLEDSVMLTVRAR